MFWLLPLWLLALYQLGLVTNLARLSLVTATLLPSSVLGCFQPDAVPTELTHRLTALPLLATPNAAWPNLYMLFFCSTGSQAAPVDKKASKRLRFQ